MDAAVNENDRIRRVSDADQAQRIVHVFAGDVGVANRLSEMKQSVTRYSMVSLPAVSPPPGVYQPVFEGTVLSGPV